jgi:hypothetical protein
MQTRERGSLLTRSWLTAALAGMVIPAFAAALPDADGDGTPNGLDVCPYFGSPNQTDTDKNGIGNVCECGDQNQDGTVNVLDLSAINRAIFDASKVTPLCDANNDGLCNVSDIVAANIKIFGRPAYCSRYPLPPDLLVIGTQQFDVLRAPTRLFESPMGNLVADAMRARYAGIDGALTNSGGLRADLRSVPPSAGEQPGEITRAEVFAVLPFANRTVVLTLTGAQLEAAFLNGLSPFCNPAISTGRFPQISGLRVRFSCSGVTPVVVGLWKGGGSIPIGPTDAVRIVTNDFMFSGGDGYTVFAAATNVVQADDLLLQLAIEHIAANSPVGPVVEGRILGP